MLKDFRVSYKENLHFWPSSR